MIPNIGTTSMGQYQIPKLGDMVVGTKELQRIQHGVDQTRNGSLRDVYQGVLSHDYMERLKWQEGAMKLAWTHLGKQETKTSWPANIV